MNIHTVHICIVSLRARVCKLIVLTLIVLVASACGPKSRGPFSDKTIKEYAAMANLKEETKRGTYIAGKPVLINIGESISHHYETAFTKDPDIEISSQTVSGLQQKINNRAENPNEVGTVVLLKWRKEVLNENLVGIEFCRVLCEVTIVDVGRHSIVGKRQFAGTSPEGTHRWGSSPENEIVEYLNGLPRGGPTPEATADRSTSVQTPNAQTPGSFVIKALLVDAEDKAIPGEAVHCLLYQGGRSFAQLAYVDGKIVAGGPKGMSDSTGSVEINVDGDFVKKSTKDFAIGVVRNGELIGVLREGKLFHFTLDQVQKANNKLDLGKVTLQTN